MGVSQSSPGRKKKKTQINISGNVNALQRVKTSFYGWGHLGKPSLKKVTCNLESEGKEHS